MHVTLIMPGKLLINCKFRGKYRSKRLALREILNVFLSVLSTCVPKCGIRTCAECYCAFVAFLRIGVGKAVL
jgi:hypothetical protein